MDDRLETGLGLRSDTSVEDTPWSREPLNSFGILLGNRCLPHVRLVRNREREESPYVIHTLSR